MRPDIDEKTTKRLHAICTARFKHPNAFGGWVEQGDVNLYRAESNGTPRFFLQSQPGDLSIDWLDVTDYMDYFNVFTVSTDHTTYK